MLIESHANQHLEFQKIRVVIPWFGRLPDYFPAWWYTAKNNKSIDFFIITDQQIDLAASNIFVICSSLSKEEQRISRVFGNKITLSSPYKLCDFRPMFGLIYSELLDGCDYWGYCDIDTALGDLDRFVGPLVISGYDRIYSLGHLCLYRNIESINLLFGKEGSIYTPQEILRGDLHVAFDERFGINRICEINNIKWYKGIDYADFSVKSKSYIINNNHNYSNQIFFWDKQGAHRAYLIDNQVSFEDFSYLHWQKKKLKVIGFEDKEDIDSFVLSNDSIIRRSNEEMSREEFAYWAERSSSSYDVLDKGGYYASKIKQFFERPTAGKRIWIRQMRCRAADAIKQKVVG